MILVTGATGLVGREVVEQLDSAGALVRAVTRNPAGAKLPETVEVVEGDPGRPGSMAAALEGVEAIFVHPRAVGLACAELLALARDAGVRKVVVLSAINVDDALDKQPSRFNGDRNYEVESAVIASGLEWVSLRASSFADNTFRAWGGQIRGGDIVRGPYADFAESPVHEADLAAAAVRGLLADEWVGQLLQITGPQSLTHAEMTKIIGDVIGRPLQYQEVPAEMAGQGLMKLGFPEGFVACLMARYANGAGLPSPVSDDLARVLERPSRTYAEWVADRAAELHS